MIDSSSQVKVFKYLFPLAFEKGRQKERASKSVEKRGEVIAVDKIKIRIEYNPIKYPEVITVKKWPDWIRKYVSHGGYGISRKHIVSWKSGIS